MIGVRGFLLILSIVCSGAIIANILSSSDGSNQDLLDSLVSNYNQNLSSEDKTDDVWVIGPSASSENEFIQNFTLPFLERNGKSEKLVHEAFFAKLKEAVCKNKNGISEDLFKKDIAMSYSFKDNNGAEVLYLSFNKHSCKKYQ